MSLNYNVPLHAFPTSWYPLCSQTHIPLVPSKEIHTAELSQLVAILTAAEHTELVLTGKYKEGHLLENVYYLHFFITIEFEV